MTQIKSHIPKIRFKEFSWEWENWKIEDNFQVSNIVWLDNQKSNINNNFLYYIILYQIMIGES